MGGAHRREGQREVDILAGGPLILGGNGVVHGLAVESEQKLAHDDNPAHGSVAAGRAQRGGRAFGLKGGVSVEEIGIWFLERGRSAPRRTIGSKPRRSTDPLEGSGCGQREELVGDPQHVDVRNSLDGDDIEIPQSLAGIAHTGQRRGDRVVQCGVTSRLAAYGGQLLRPEIENLEESQGDDPVRRGDIGEFLHEDSRPCPYPDKW